MRLLYPIKSNRNKRPTMVKIIVKKEIKKRSTWPPVGRISCHQDLQRLPHKHNKDTSGSNHDVRDTRTISRIYPGKVPSWVGENSLTGMSVSLYAQDRESK